MGVFIPQGLGFRGFSHGSIFAGVLTNLCFPFWGDPEYLGKNQLFSTMRDLLVFSSWVTGILVGLRSLV